MWKRKELKSRARQVVICFLIALLTGEFGTSILGIYQQEDSMNPYYIFMHKDEIADECKNHDVDIISLIAPASHDRIKMIAKEATGFIYCVSSLGVTGVRSDINTDLGGMIKLWQEAVMRLQAAEKYLNI